MRPKNIHHHIEDYYAAKNLPMETLARLEAAVSRSRGGSQQKTGPRFAHWTSFLKIPFRKPAALIGALCVVVLAQFVFFAMQPDRPAKNGFYPLENAVIREISMNHRKNLQAEYKVPAIGALSQVMAKLDFTPVSPEPLKLENFTLIGARYCSIQGNLAVLITLRDESGRRYSLYQAPLDGGLAHIPKLKTNQDGTTVSLWTEKTIFMGLVGPSVVW
jgi:hypothetical protein